MFDRSDYKLRITVVKPRVTLTLCCSDCTNINSRHNSVIHANFPQVFWRKSRFTTVIMNRVENPPNLRLLFRIFECW